MRACELIEGLMDSSEIQVMVYDHLGELVPCKITPLLTKAGKRIVIGPITNSLVQRAADPLSLNAYQDYAFGEAIYPECGQGSVRAISLALSGLVGEGGKAMHSWFDTMRGGKALSQETKNDLAVGLGNALWFLSAAAKELGVTMSQLGAQSIRQARAWRREQELVDRQPALLARSSRMAQAGES